ncbi:hypothetical protein ACHWQZ_G005433 [Mnemiopsis leidyi]
MSDTDYSDSDDEPQIHISHGHSNDPGLQLNDALAKLKHWKSKYQKCYKEKERGIGAQKEANLKIKNLTETKLAYDKLKVDFDVDKRDWEIRLSNECEQTKKFQVLLKKNKASLEEMTQKHREIAELNKVNEAKLFQTKIEYAGAVSNVANLEEQLAQVKDEFRSSREVIQEQAGTIQSLSSEGSSLKKDNELLKDRCQELSSQLNEFRSICERLDKKCASLTQEHLALKNDSDLNNSTLTKSITESREEALLLTKERDTLALNYSHTKESLAETQKKLEELQEIYKKEKSSADENSILLKQAEMSIQHLKELYTEKESQLKKQTTDLESQVSGLKHEIETTRAQLHEAQAQRGGQSVNTTNTEQIAALNTELGHLTATSQHLNQKIKQLEEEKDQDVHRFEKLSEERNQLIKEKNDLEIEMGKQRDGFKEEIRNLKNEMKSSENKHEVLRKKLEGSREELAKMEHELRGLQTAVTEKTNSNNRLTEEIGVLKTENNVISHQLNEIKTTSQERFTEIENLKTRITVIQEDNKNIRQKSEDGLLKVKEKEVVCKELQDKLTEMQQKLHSDQIKHIEDVSVVKEELQEKIYSLESEIKQIKFERDNKESQIVALKEQIGKRAEEKVSSSAVPVPTGISEEAAKQYRELYDKHTALQGEIQQLKSQNIILENSATQLKFNLESERERLSATEQAMKNTTDLLNDTKDKMGDVQSLNNKANNDISRLDELLKVEREKYSRLSGEYDIERSSTVKLNNSIASYKEQIEKLKEASKQQVAERAALEKELAEKEQMLSSEAKLRLHMSSQLSSNSTYETALENERKKSEKLEDKCEVLTDQIERLKTSLEENETSRRKLREELEEATRPQPNAGQHEEKIRALKQKLSSERENLKKVQEDLAKKVKKSQLLLKEEAAQRKELTDKYIAVKSEIGELQGKMTVLLADNERLKSQLESLRTEKDTLVQEKSEIETKMRSDYILRTEVEMSKKNLEARNRVEYNKRLQEMNLKWDQDNKSREAMDKFKASTESKIREDLEKSNRQLKQKVSDCMEQFDQHEQQFSKLELENEKLRQILAEERRTMERLLPSFGADQTSVPRLSLPASPRSPHRQGENIRATQDSNAAWLLMKSRLNETLNKCLVEHEVSPGRSLGDVTPGRNQNISGMVTPGRTTPGRITPSSTRRAELIVDPDPARTSADSFL